MCVYAIQSSTLSIFSECLFFCETFPCFVLDGSSAPLFRACRFFHKLVDFLAIVFLQVFFDTLALFFNTCLLCFSHAFFLLTCWLVSLYSCAHSVVFFVLMLKRIGKDAPYKTCPLPTRKRTSQNCPTFQQPLEKRTPEQVLKYSNISDVASSLLIADSAIR